MLLTRYAQFVVRRRKAFVLGYVAVVAIVAAVGIQVLPLLKAEGFEAPSSQSAEVAHLLERDFDTRQPVAVIGATGSGGVNSAATTKAATALVAEITAVPGVATVRSYWTSGKPANLRGNDGRTGEILVYAAPGADSLAIARQLTDDYSGSYDGLEVRIAGFGAVFNAIDDRVRSDLAKAELVAIPITIILLLFVFGSLVAAGLPFLVALLAILGSFSLLLAVTQVADVSVFALNLVTALGLGLGIDYALLMINRFREELGRGVATEDAVVTTVATAGKTVIVSGLTVAFTLASLIVFPQYFLKSFAYAGVAVSLMAVLGALTVLPALLALLGPNVNRFKLLRGDLSPRDDGIWARLARTSMRRPWPYLLGGVLVMLVLASPALSLVVGQVDDRALPRDDPAAVASQFLDERFPGFDGAPYELLLRDPGDAAALATYGKDLSTLPGVVRVATPAAIFSDGAKVGPNEAGTTWTEGDLARVVVIGSVPPRDDRGVALVEALRDQPAPAAAVLVGGVAAEYGDSNDAIIGNVWIVALWIGLTTLLIIFLYTGSVLLPIKALLLNLLSLSATLGVLVWIFQDGHLQWLTGDYVVTGTVDLSSLALVAVVAFALSMDYELFLLSRIKEEHDAGHSTEDSVAFGLQRTGRIITAAALLIAIVFAAFLSSGITSIKPTGGRRRGCSASTDASASARASGDTAALGGYPTKLPSRSRTLACDSARLRPKAIRPETSPASCPAARPLPRPLLMAALTSSSLAPVLCSSVASAAGSARAEKTSKVGAPSWHAASTTPISATWASASLVADVGDHGNGSHGSSSPRTIARMRSTGATLAAAARMLPSLPARAPAAWACSIEATIAVRTAASTSAGGRPDRSASPCNPAGSASAETASIGATPRVQAARSPVRTPISAVTAARPSTGFHGSSAQAPLSLRTAASS